MPNSFVANVQQVVRKISFVSRGNTRRTMFYIIFSSYVAVLRQTPRRFTDLVSSRFYEGALL